ncbi:Glucose dehydrogenase [FAD, quinone] [Orchesella cincta]|uniref:Glucose dehydrogenase [FAD, quinone] n=1 Tax=Orchesella cincta TaxID=48709 RepID=A0A1D2M302_ORCCI|nr:Glucose dehydrogenase [FAD, quinone] [Orchesella cincta]
MLGGSTSHNFMMYVRGNKEDFNRWSTEDLGGDPQWNYENLLPYFKKSEDYNGNYARDPASAKYHGNGGLLNVAKYDFEPGADDFLAAALEKGYAIGDYNGATQEVFSKVDATTQDGWRESTYRAFYKDTGKPSNLCIKKYAHVIKINFQYVSSHPKAVGVTYKRQGVGPAEHLHSLNIPLVRIYLLGKESKTTDAGQGFLKSPVAQPNYVDLQLIHTAFALYHNFLKTLITNARFAFVVLGRPKSFGKLMLASSNPDDNPIIDPKFLTHPDDVEALLYGLKKFVDLYENTAALNTPLFHKPVPGCENKAFKSDDYYRCVISMFSFTFYHHVGSCALGKVVDSHLKVMGIDGLRVIDASVIPRLPNGKHAGCTIMIAEKGSDLIISNHVLVLLTRANSNFKAHFHLF